jgi:hypothetical protein
LQKAKEFFLHFILPVMLTSESPMITFPLSQYIAKERDMNDFAAINEGIKALEPLPQTELEVLVCHSMHEAITQLGGDVQVLLLKQDHETSRSKFTLHGFALYQLFCSNLYVCSTRSWCFHLVTKAAEDDAIRANLINMGSLLYRMFYNTQTKLYADLPKQLLCRNREGKTSISSACRAAAELLAFEATSDKINSVYEPIDATSLKVQDAVHDARKFCIAETARIKKYREEGGIGMETMLSKKQTAVSYMHTLLSMSVFHTHQASEYFEYVKTEFNFSKCTESFAFKGEEFIKRTRYIAALQDKYPELFQEIIQECAERPLKEQHATPEEMRRCRLQPDSYGVDFFAIATAEILKCFKAIMHLYVELEKYWQSEDVSHASHQLERHSAKESADFQKSEQLWEIQTQVARRHTSLYLRNNASYFDRRRTHSRPPCRNRFEFELCEFSEQEQADFELHEPCCVSEGVTSIDDWDDNGSSPYLKERRDLYTLNVFEAIEGSPEGRLPWVYHRMPITLYPPIDTVNSIGQMYQGAFREYMQHSCPERRQPLAADHDLANARTVAKGKNLHYLTNALYTNLSLILNLATDAIGKEKRKMTHDMWGALCNCMHD